MIPLFEDNHLLVINKPAGLLTQPSGTQQDNLEDRAKNWLKDKYQKPGNVFLEAIHRLDKPVSGVVVFAKTSKALSRLHATLRSKESCKIYLAWIEGELSSEQGTLEHVLSHDHFFAKVVDTHHKEGKKARLTYRVLDKRKNRTLVEIELETGRYHQIRLQFTSIGHPIIGDEKYGAKQKYQIGSIALHHHKFQLPHPISKERLTFEAPPPEAFMSLFH